MDTSQTQSSTMAGVQPSLAEIDVPTGLSFSSVDVGEGNAFYVDGKSSPSMTVITFTLAEAGSTTKADATADGLTLVLSAPRGGKKFRLILAPLT